MTKQQALFENGPEEEKSPQTKRATIQPDAATDEAVIAQVYAVVRAIPAGRVMSYGAVGARCNPPISGYICGRIMNNAISDVPWWRVVAKDGSLPIGKRNPHLAREQRAKLEEEGVKFDEAGRIIQSLFVT